MIKVSDEMEWNDVLRTAWSGAKDTAERRKGRCVRGTH